MHSGTGLKLILETDAIVHPLTGIGRYALELLRSFQASKDFSDIRCLSRGQWYKPDTVLEEARIWEEQIEGSPQSTVSGRLSNNPVKHALRRLVPYLNQRSMHKFADSHIYHSPNYRLASFPGKKIVTFHDLSLFLYPQYHFEDRLKLLRPAIEHAAQVADHLITDSQQVRQEVISYFGIAPESISAIPLATSLKKESVNVNARNSFLRQTGLKPGSYFLFVSTLEPRKNISGLLGAYELLPPVIRKRYPLVLAGQLGWKSESIAEALDRAKRRGDVIQLGYLSNHQLCHLYSGARAFVYPSFYEGFGLPIIEAQEFGVPVITSDCSCMPEVAGEGAILVNPQAYGSLAQAMQSLVEDDHLHSRLSALAAENARKYSWDETARLTAALYGDVSKT